MATFATFADALTPDDPFLKRGQEKGFAAGFVLADVLRQTGGVTRPRLPCQRSSASASGQWRRSPRTTNFSASRIFPKCRCRWKTAASLTRRPTLSWSAAWTSVERRPSMAADSGHRRLSLAARRTQNSRHVPRGSHRGTRNSYRRFQHASHGASCEAPDLTPGLPRCPGSDRPRTGATLGATGTDNLVADRTRMDNAKRLFRCQGLT